VEEWDVQKGNENGQISGRGGRPPTVPPTEGLSQETVMFYFSQIVDLQA